VSGHLLDGPADDASRPAGPGRDGLGRWGGRELQTDLEWRLTVAVEARAAESNDSLQRSAGVGFLVDGERVATALCDGVDPGAVVGGVDAVGQSPAGQRDVRTLAVVDAEGANRL